MRIFPYFHKLFASPVLVLESVRSAMEMDLLRVAGVQLNAESQRPMPKRAYGADGEPFEGDLQIMRRIEATKAAWRVEQIYRVTGNVATVHIAGVLDKHLSDYDLDCYGGCDMADVDRALIAANNDPAVQQVVLAINSPGGSVSGILETGARIRALRKNHEVHAFVDGMACSAAQWLAAQADKTVMAPSAMAGSIGVYLALVDARRAAELEGYKVELIRAGKWKAMGSPFKELTSEERAMFQKEVDGLHVAFKAAVREGRGREIGDEWMEGQALSAEQAFEAGLVDSFTTANLEEYVAALARR